MIQAKDGQRRDAGVLRRAERELTSPRVNPGEPEEHR